MKVIGILQNIMTSSINVQTVDIKGNIMPNQDITISLVPNQKIGAILLKEYIFNKVMYDTEDLGYANLISNDIHTMITEVSGRGNVTLPTSIMASLFPQRGEQIEIEQYTNLNENELYQMYRQNSELVKWGHSNRHGIRCRCPLYFEHN